MALSCTSFKANCEALFNCTRTLQSEKLHYVTEGRNKLLKKKLIRRYLKEKRKMMQPNCPKPFLTSAVPMSIVTSMNSPFCYEQDYTYPVAVSDWNGFHSPVLAIHPAPLILPSPGSIFAPHIIPITGIVQPVISPIVPVTQSFVPEEVTSVTNYINDYNFSAELLDNTAFANRDTHYIHEESFTQNKSKHDNEVEVGRNKNKGDEVDIIEAYLILPKELFPTARMMTLDPNPIIDEFCKMPDIQRHMPWLLDLEFGIPKSPITRPIPIYNVKFNSIHCKNTPDAIHPGFESCGPDFKRALLFYYDCIVSAWYRGYVVMNCDQSVENFQSWLLLPMQVLGMCWP